MYIMESNESKLYTFSQIEIIRKFELNKIRYCNCVCLSPDGSIWISGHEYVYKMSSDCSTVLIQISAREKLNCGYIACLQSGDAVASYGSTPYVDRFTSDGKRVEFIKLPDRITFDISANTQDEVLINVSFHSIVIYSNEGQLLRDFPVDGGIWTFCTDRDGNIIIVSHKGSPTLTVLDGMSGEVKTSWALSMNDIGRILCDIHGNIIATNRHKNVYFFSKDGKIQKTYSVDCDEINGICVNKEDHLLILMKLNNEYKILVTKYLE